jgi:hypothetical protein
MPLALWRHVLLALRQGEAGLAQAVAEAMERTLGEAGDTMLPEHAVMCRFDLAKFWSGLGQHGRAFSQWQAGHALLRRYQPFSREAHREFVDTSIAAFPASRFRDGPRAANADPAPVFIVGMPRSGGRRSWSRSSMRMSKRAASASVWR